jgi:hypothetical protein
MSTTLRLPKRATSLLQLLLLVPRALHTYAAPLTVEILKKGGEGGHDHDAEPGSDEFWWKLGLSAVLVLLGGIFAGLTLGLMGLDLVRWHFFPSLCIELTFSSRR